MSDVVDFVWVTLEVTFVDRRRGDTLFVTRHISEDVSASCAQIFARITAGNSKISDQKLGNEEPSDFSAGTGYTTVFLRLNKSG